MKSFLSDHQSSDAVVNYSSSSYGGFLFRSPNSPPPSPSPSSDSLSQLFLAARSGINGSWVAPAACYSSYPSGCFQLWQPPLLPSPSNWVPEAIRASSIRSRRKNSKRKGKMFVGAMKEAPPSPTANGMMFKAKSIENEERRSSEGKEMESVYSQSPSPSSLPFPKFSMTRPKDNVSVAGTLAGAGIAEKPATMNDF